MTSIHKIRNQAEADVAFIAAIEAHNTANPDKAIEIVGESCTVTRLQISAMEACTYALIQGLTPDTLK